MCDNGYDYGVPITYGGAAGTYPMRSPWNSESEMCILMCAFQSAGAVQAINLLNNLDSPGGLITTNQASSTDGQAFTPGYFWQSGARQSYPMLEVWVPVDNDINWQCIVASGTVATLTVAWRRKKQPRKDIAPASATVSVDELSLMVLHKIREQEAIALRNGR